MKECYEFSRTIGPLAVLVLNPAHQFLKQGWYPAQRTQRKERK